MAITSKDIQEQSFKIERRGYDVDEVDVFLERVSDEIDSLNNEVANLRTQLADAQRMAKNASAAEPAQESRPEASAAPAVDSAELARKDARIAELEARVRERKNEDAAIAQALIVAQLTGDEIVSKAKADAEQTRQNAEEEARRILDKAGNEKQRVVESINELNAARAEIRTQYQDLLKEFIGSATKRLTEIGGDSDTPAFIPSSVQVTGEVPVPTTATPISNTAPAWEGSSVTATYTTPTISSVVSAPATPKPSVAAKDLSGYGDADDSFSFDEID